MVPILVLFVVSGGQVTLPKASEQSLVGLDYEGFYKSTKLSFGAKDGTALGQLGRPNRITFILRNTMTGGVYGQNFDDMEVLADRSTADSLDSGPTWWSGTLDNLPIKDLSVDSRIIEAQGGLDRRSSRALCWGMNWSRGRHDMDAVDKEMELRSGRVQIPKFRHEDGES